MSIVTFDNIPAAGDVVYFSTLGFGRTHQQSATVLSVIPPRQFVPEFTVCIDGTHGGKPRWLTVRADGVKLENGADVQRVSAAW